MARVVEGRTVRSVCNCNKDYLSIIIIIIMVDMFPREFKN